MIFKICIYKVLEKKTWNSVGGGNTVKGNTRRSLTDIKVVENTHTQMERRREDRGEGKEVEVACNKQMER